MERINRGEDLNRITKFLQFADIQVQGLKKQTIPVTFDIPDPDLAEFFKKKFPDAQNEQISYAHNLYDGEEKKDFWYFPEEFESLGTRKLFNYAGIILPILDNFERAIKLDDNNLEDELSKFLNGFKMIYTNLIEVLNKYEVKEKMILIDFLEKVLKKSHKGIVIGKDGSMLKKIGTYARQDLEKEFQEKINNIIII